MHTIEVLHDHIVSPQHQVSFSSSSETFLGSLCLCLALVYLSIQALDMENPLIVQRHAQVSPFPLIIALMSMARLFQWKRTSSLLITPAIITLFFLLDSSPETMKLV